MSAALFAACGVEFRSAPQGNEFFQSLEVTGRMEPGAPLTAALAYETYYPVPVEVACEIRTTEELVKEIGRYTAPALEGGDPDSTPVPGNIAFDFTIDEPGSYRAECYTPEDEDSYIRESFTIRAP
jgi:hypothetical protein